MIKDYSEQVAASKALSLDGTIRTFINVPYRDKDEVKSKGGRWDPSSKSWYFRGNKAEVFARWLPSMQEMKSRLEHLAKDDN